MAEKVVKGSDKEQLAKHFREIGEHYISLSKLLSSGVELTETTEAEVASIAATTSQKQGVKTPDKVVNKPAKEEVAEAVEVAKPSEDDYESMSIGNLRKLAREMGVEATGTKEEIIARLSEQQAAAGEENENVDISAQVEELTKDMSVEEIADVLTSVGIKPTGKRQALIAKVVQAVEDKLISLTEEDGDGADAPNSEEPSQKEEASNDESNGEEDEILEVTTQERQDAFDAYEEQCTQAVKDKDLTEDDIDELLTEVYNDDYDSKDTSSEDKLAMYIQYGQSLIDDEGAQHDPGEPYLVNDKYACCGAFLKEADGKMICEICGGEYEVE